MSDKNSQICQKEILKARRPAPASAKDNMCTERWENEAGRHSLEIETSVNTAIADADEEPLPLTQKSRREETATATATAKRKRQQSEEEEDILPVKEARIMLAMANQHMTIASKESEGTSFPTASTSNEEVITQREQHPTQYVSNSSMPHYVTFPRFADHGCHAHRKVSSHIEDGGTKETSIESERNFPANLHAILADEQYTNIISWMPHGHAWKVHDKTLLVSDVGEALGICDYPSFKRHLSEWGFKRLYQTGPDYGCYYHECFLRGYSQSVPRMKKTVEPDFYAMVKRYPLDKAADMDTERVLFLANVALQYSFESSADKYTCQTEPYGQRHLKDPLCLSRKKSTRMKSLKASKRGKASKVVEDLPPQDDPLTIATTARLNALMERTHVSQKQLETYDRRNGLPRSHSRTMMRSGRSRLEFQNVLKTWELRKTNTDVIGELGR